MPTYHELKERTARKLGILNDAMSLSADDGAIIGQALLDVQDQFYSLSQLPGLDVENGCDNEHADPVVSMAAAQLVDEYGTPEPRRSQLVMGGRIGLIPPSIAYRLLKKMLEDRAKLQTVVDFTVI